MKSLVFGLFLVLLIGCKKEEPAPGAAPAPKTTTSSGNPLTAPVDYLGAVAKSKTSMEKRIDSVSLNQAIQLFQATEGRNPKDLNELVKEGTIPKLPEPPYNHKFVYDPVAGTAKVVPK